VETDALSRNQLPVFCFLPESTPTANHHPTRVGSGSTAGHGSRRLEREDEQLLKKGIAKSTENVYTAPQRAMELYMCIRRCCNFTSLETLSAVEP
jgi:hypothetical protein